MCFNSASEQTSADREGQTNWLYWSLLAVTSMKEIYEEQSWDLINHIFKLRYFYSCWVFFFVSYIRVIENSIQKSLQ